MLDRHYSSVQRAGLCVQGCGLMAKHEPDATVGPLMSDYEIRAQSILAGLQEPV